MPRHTSHYFSTTAHDYSKILSEMVENIHSFVVVMSWMLKHPNFRLWNGTVDSPNSLSVVEQVTQYNNELTPCFSKVAFQGYTRCKLTPFGQFGIFLPFLAKIDSPAPASDNDMVWWQPVSVIQSYSISYIMVLCKASHILWEISQKQGGTFFLPSQCRSTTTCLDCGSIGCWTLFSRL